MRNKLFGFAILILVASTARAQDSTSAMMNRIAVDQKLDSSAPLDLVFRDEAGKSVKLSEYFHGKPVVLSLVYYRCPGLCTMTLNGMVKSFRPLKFSAGKDFEVLTISIDPKETPELARQKKFQYIDSYRREGSENGWHFLTGDQAAISKIAESVGFKYVYDPVSGQFAHASAIMVLTPGGKISRYFYGLEYAPRDLQFGLIDASQNKIGNLADALILLCYHYDPSTAKYGLAVMKLIRGGSVATILAIGGYVLIKIRRERITHGQDARVTAAA